MFLGPLHGMYHTSEVLAKSTEVFTLVFQGISICTNAKCLEHNEIMCYMSLHHTQTMLFREKLSPLLPRLAN